MGHTWRLDIGDENFTLRAFTCFYLYLFRVMLHLIFGFCLASSLKTTIGSDLKKYLFFFYKL